MRFAVIEAGTVINIVTGDETLAAQRGWIALAGPVDIGWLYDAGTGVFTAPPPQAEPVPEVSMVQARLALLGSGLLAGVEAAIAAMPSPDKEAALIVWDYSVSVRRDAPLVATLAQALGLDDPAIDALFAAARTL